MKPLEGIRVLDLSRVLAGPWCTQLLADLGAEVLKIERPGAGDDTRHWGPPWYGEGDERVAAYFLSANRGKKSAAIDFSQPQGARLVRETRRAGGCRRRELQSRGTEEIRPRRYFAARGQSTADLCLHHGFWTGRSLRRPRRLRLHHPRHGRTNEHYWPARRRAGRWADARWSGRRRSIHRSLHLRRHPQRTLASREDRGGRSHRHGAIRHPAGDARQSGVECAGFRQGPAAAGQYPSKHRALPAVRCGRSADHHRRWQRSPVCAARANVRSPRVDQRRTLRQQRFACC